MSAKAKIKDEICGDIDIDVIVRFGKNGRKYVWNEPTQKKVDELVAKYGIDQISGTCLWLQN